MIKIKASYESQRELDRLKALFRPYTVEIKQDKQNKGQQYMRSYFKLDIDKERGHYP